MQIDNFTKYSLKKKIIAGPVIFLAIMGIIVFFIVMPAINDIKKIKNEVEAERIDLEKKYIKGQSLKQLKENLQEIKPDLEKLNNVFVINEQELDFITTLENFAHENNVEQKINMDAFKNLDKSKALQEIRLNLSLAGGFTELLNYLADLESSHYYITVNSLEVSSASAKSPIAGKDLGLSSGISMAISANIYWVNK
ncbi:type II secretion system protein M [Patescibacteria group bacterium]|nr:hypothetical protein [Candidatus Falkowbacteria bacterium]MBU3905897.1 type II secretion system protein M [Patescibacteria group bacterium]MCG2698064.1 type II secretion system protein M [Candidatus Parcubacteria bacterium]MBU4015427.1 type II secretion system protein M [Patescibacteria group bacterium]MBU4026688.1 type II secretion system protein M [Patescibacteria group bacterium]